MTQAQSDEGSIFCASDLHTRQQTFVAGVLAGKRLCLPPRHGAAAIYPLMEWCWATSMGSSDFGRPRARDLRRELASILAQLEQGVGLSVAGMVVCGHSPHQRLTHCRCEP